MTALDRAHAAMAAAPEDDTRRLAFYERLADAELFLLLDAEPSGDNATPRHFGTSEGSFVLAFDREDRLTTFTEGPAPYAALSGRAIARMLAEQDIGIALNPEVAPSSILIPANAISWLTATLSKTPRESHLTAAELRPPTGLPETLIESLDAKLAAMEGLARVGYLSGVSYKNGTQSHLLALIDPAPGAEPALAQAISEALIFSGLEAGSLDVAFFPATSPIAARLAKTGLRFDLPEPVIPKPRESNPDTPPRLR